MLDRLSDIADSLEKRGYGDVDVSDSAQDARAFARRDAAFVRQVITALRMLQRAVEPLSPHSAPVAVIYNALDGVGADKNVGEPWRSAAQLAVEFLRGAR